MKRMFVLSMVIMAVLMLFAGSGVVQAQAPDDGTRPMYAITYGKGLILTSLDSENWTVRASGTLMPLADIEFGNGIFVAVGARGTIVTGSKDGATWTLRQSGVTSDLWAIKRAKGIFVAVGSAGTVITSPDGYTWTKKGEHFSLCTEESCLWQG